MSRPAARICLPLVILAGCASSPDLEPAEVVIPGEDESAAVPVEADAPAEEPRRSSLHEAVLEIWSDPAFEKRFAESYFADSEVEPPVTLNESEEMQQIYGLMTSGEIDEARKLLDKYGGRSASALFDFTSATLHYQQDELEEALEEYRIAVDKYPNYRRAWRTMGEVHFRLGEFAEAGRAFTRFIELGGADAITYGLLAVTYMSAEEYLAAESAFRMSMLMAPGFFNWKMGLAESLFRQRRFPDAVALFDSLIAEQPDNPQLWLLQGNAHLGLEQWLEAAKDFEMVEALGASTADSLQKLGDIYTHEQLYDVAADAYIRAMESSPEGGAPRAIRAARGLMDRGATEDARRLVERIEARYGERFDATAQTEFLRLRALLALAEGADDEEARVLQEIIRLDPLDGGAFIQLGRHSRRKGDTATAEHYFEQAAEIEGFEAPAKLGLAELMVEEDRLAEALPLLRRAQALDPRDDVQAFLEHVERALQRR